MHIPDGYLSPQTTIPAFVIMSGIWYIALRKVKSQVNTFLTPLISLCAAFSFVIMMFNVPIVGGSSAHVVGAVLVAILIGPWAAVLAISTTLVIQAFMFGDGGILALGVNCLNMAVIMPFTGFAIYRLLIKENDISSKRNLFAAFCASYIGISLAALTVAIEMGVQPIFFITLDHVPLYGFYGLNVTIPAMMFSHMLVIAPLEGVVTVIVLNYVAKYAPQLLNQNLNLEQKVINYKKFILILITLSLLTPLGLFATGTAFGEWGIGEVKALIGYVPFGMAKTADLWSALMPDYSLPDIFHLGKISASVGYILSALVGISSIGILVMLSAKITRVKKN